MADLQEDFTKMVTTLFKSGEKMQQELTVTDLELLHAIIGVGGEVGEVISAIEERDKENLLEEMGDLEFYLNRIRTILNLPSHNVPNEESLHSKEVCSAHVEGVLAEAKDEIGILSSQIIDLVKKSTIYRQELKLDAVRVTLELFDRSFEVIYRAMEVTRKDVLEHNMKKLGKRYEKGYSDQAAKDRADKK